MFLNTDQLMGIFLNIIKLLEAGWGVSKHTQIIRSRLRLLLLKTNGSLEEVGGYF